mgnify:CR=1 FL=1|tara:strand:- start:1328 stop:1645 length:318 start_codon:yes stop_codon:yes gene_type:complete
MTGVARLPTPAESRHGAYRIFKIRGHDIWVERDWIQSEAGYEYVLVPPAGMEWSDGRSALVIAAPAKLSEAVEAAAIEHLEVERWDQDDGDYWDAERIENAEIEG